MLPRGSRTTSVPTPTPTPTTLGMRLVTALPERLNQKYFKIEIKILQEIFKSGMFDCSLDFASKKTLTTNYDYIILIENNT